MSTVFKMSTEPIPEDTTYLSKLWSLFSPYYSISTPVIKFPL